MSPILEVPATGLTPSGARKTKSPPISKTLSVATQPTLVVTGSRTKVVTLDPPTDIVCKFAFLILLLANIKRLSLKGLKFTTLRPKLNRPAEPAPDVVQL